MQVRVLLPAPRRRKLHIACDDFFMLRMKTHPARIPLLLLFPIELAALGFDGVPDFHFGSGIFFNLPFCIECS